MLFTNTHVKCIQRWIHSTAPRERVLMANVAIVQIDIHLSLVDSESPLLYITQINCQQIECRETLRYSSSNAHTHTEIITVE